MKWPILNVTFNSNGRMPASKGKGNGMHEHSMHEHSSALQQHWHTCDTEIHAVGRSYSTPL